MSWWLRSPCSYTKSHPGKLEVSWQNMVAQDGLVETRHVDTTGDKQYIPLVAVGEQVSVLGNLTSTGRAFQLKEQIQAKVFHDMLRASTARESNVELLDSL